METCFNVWWVGVAVRHTTLSLHANEERNNVESLDWIWIWIEGGGGGGGGFGKATAIATDSGERERVSTSMDKGH